MANCAVVLVAVDDCASVSFIMYISFVVDVLGIACRRCGGGSGRRGSDCDARASRGRRLLLVG
jgi:hypothetical protein